MMASVEVEKGFLVRIWNGHVYPKKQDCSRVSSGPDLNEFVLGSENSRCCQPLSNLLITFNSNSPEVETNKNELLY